MDIRRRAECTAACGVQSTSCDACAASFAAPACEAPANDSPALHQSAPTCRHCRSRRRRHAPRPCQNLKRLRRQTHSHWPISGHCAGRQAQQFAISPIICCRRWQPPTCCVKEAVLPGRSAAPCRSRASALGAAPSSAAFARPAGLVAMLLPTALSGCSAPRSGCWTCPACCRRCGQLVAAAQQAAGAAEAGAAAAPRPALLLSALAPAAAAAGCCCRCGRRRRRATLSLRTGRTSSRSGSTRDAFAASP